MSQEDVHPTAAIGYDKLTSQLYERIRPSYSKEVVNFVLDKLGISPKDASTDQPVRILELGAGTGKFTRTLQEVLRDSKVQIIASEPLLSMREEFGKKLPDIEIKGFPAENIDLPDGSVHAVIAAQCFHWFANDKSISEIHRVLVPGGKLGIVFNNRDQAVPWVKELDEDFLFPLYVQSNTPSEHSGIWKKVLTASDKFGPMDNDETFKMEQTFTFDEFIARLMSFSVMAVKSEEEKQVAVERIKFILSKHNKKEKDVITQPFIVNIYWCQRT
ncbi:uncharacterized protein LOC144631927 [Oculina patagonica]